MAAEADGPPDSVAAASSTSELEQSDLGQSGSKQPERLRPESLTREILHLALPAALQNILHTVLFLVDTKMVGIYAGGESSAPLAALTVTGPIVWSLTVIFTVISVGTTALVARRVGEGDHDGARGTTTTSLWLAGGVGVVVAIGGWLTAGVIVDALASQVSGGASGELRGAATGYLFWFFVLFPFRSLAIVMEAAFRGAGDTVRPLMGGIFANIVNIAANALFIFGLFGLPRMGVAGAGLGTALAAVAEAILLGWILFAGRSPRLSLPRGVRWRFLSARASAVTRVSVPAFVEAVIFHSGYVAFQIAILNFEESAIAAHRIAISVQSMVFMPAVGFYVAAASLSGRLLGAGNPQLAETAIQRTGRIGLAFMVPLSLLFLFVPGPIAAFLSENPAEWMAAAICLQIGALEIPFLLCTEVLRGGLRGAGETRGPVVVSLVGTWFIRVPLSWTLGVTLDWGLVGIWSATVVDWAVRFALLAWLFRRGRWKRLVI